MQLPNVIFEDVADASVDHRVHYPCDCVHSTDDRTNADNKVDQASVISRHVFGDGRELVIEHENVLSMSFGLIVSHFIILD